MPQTRFWELDFFRGLGVIMFLIFHFVLDLNFFGLNKVQPYEGFWFFFQRVTATLFILLVGISLSISYAHSSSFSKFLKRAISLFAISLLITFATWIYPHEGFIVFGVLHFISAAIILAYFFQKFFYLNLFAGIASILLGFKLNETIVDNQFLFWLGLPFPGFYTLDYFPIFPWLGVILIGLFLGKLFYPNAKCSFKLSQPNLPIVPFLQFLGQRSLQIYLAHQPILIALILAYKSLLP